MNVIFFHSRPQLQARLRRSSFQACTKGVDSNGANTFTLLSLKRVKYYGVTTQIRVVLSDSVVSFLILYNTKFAEVYLISRMLLSVAYRPKRLRKHVVSVSADNFHVLHGAEVEEVRGAMNLVVELFGIGQL